MYTFCDCFQQQTSAAENLSLLEAALVDLSRLTPERHRTFTITTNDLINALVHPDVIKLATKKLIKIDQLKT
jgi:hypothetical protein